MVFNQYIILALQNIFAIITCIYFSQISALIYIIIEYILMKLAQIYVVCSKLHRRIFASLLVMDINRCQGRRSIKDLHSAALWQKQKQKKASKIIILPLRRRQNSQVAIYVNPKLWTSKVINGKTLILEEGT